VGAGCEKDVHPSTAMRSKQTYGGGVDSYGKSAHKRTAAIGDGSASKEKSDVVKKEEAVMMSERGKPV
jgi:hypothetical protein